MIWAISDPLRFAAERGAVARLEAAQPWLTVRAWNATADGISVEFDIRLDYAVFDGVLRYPASFPAIPPRLLPREARRWSGHQYGTGGELCLEWGPDNWVPEVTGAMMIESAYRLLSDEAGETVERQTVPEPVPSRHALTVGQNLRFEARRFLSTSPLEERLATLAAPVPASFRMRVRDKGWLALLSTLDGDTEWLDASIPAAIMDAGLKIPGVVLPVKGWPNALPTDAAILRQTLLGGAASEGTDWEMLLCREPDGTLHALLLTHDTNFAVELAIIQAEQQRRLEGDYASLAAKTVGLVGCGSLGSKIAVSLARSGVGHFLLIDDDILRPGNLVRHDLDWTYVGRHKADALADRLNVINPAIEALVRRFRLGGQESNGSTDGLISKLAGCDLIVDATADGRAFNYAAAAAAEKRRPMVWAEIFGGGFGGLVARSRPALEPEPQMARARIEAWCAEQGIDVPRPERDYAASDGNVTMIADDAAVTVMAGHAAGLALDSLLARNPSRYPHSAYLVGLDSKWIFREPFDVCPIALGPVTPSRAPLDLDDPEVGAALADLGSLLAR